MSIANSRHDFSVDALEAVVEELGATEYQVAVSYHRALHRTSATVKQLTNRMARDEMQVKTLKAVRKRFQQFKLKVPKRWDGDAQRKRHVFGELKVWFGLNDMSVGYLKGRIHKNGKKGATFTQKGQKHTFENGFIARMYGRRSIFTRTPGKPGVREARLEIRDGIQEAIEDQILSEIPDIFMRHFETDLKGRVLMGLNKGAYRE